MTTKIESFNQKQTKQNLSDIRSGDTIKVYQKIKEKDKERIQIFEGLVIARKHGKGINSTITVRKVMSGIGVEKTFPVHSPNIEKIEIVKRGKTRRAKLYYLRTAKGTKARLKRKEFTQAIIEEKPIETPPTEEVQSKEEVLEINEKSEDKKEGEERKEEKEQSKN